MPLTIKTDDITSSRKGVDPHGQLRGEWVNEFEKYLCKCTFPNKSTLMSSLSGQKNNWLNLNTKNLKFRKSVFDYILKHVKGNQGIYLQDIRVFLKNLLVQFKCTKSNF